MYLTLGLSTLLMTGACTDGTEELPVNDGRVAVSFSGGIVQTRVTTAGWEPNDAIGVYMLESGTLTVADNAVNRRHVTAAGDGRFTPDGEGQSIYFPADEADKVDFIAYYPRTELTDHVYKVDVSDQTNPAAIDLVYSNNATGHDKSTQTVSLIFRHRLSRVEVQLHAGEGMDETELEGVGVSLSNQPVTADFNVLHNTLDATDSRATLMLNPAKDSPTASAIILPQEGTEGRELAISLQDGTRYACMLEDSRTFEAGKKTVFRITLKRTSAGTEVEVDSTIQPWDTQDIVSDDIEIETTESL